MISLVVSLFLGIGGVQTQTTPCPSPSWTCDQEGVVRGDPEERELALVFTGGEFGEGTEHILDSLKRFGVKASFFVTGEYLRHSIQPSRVRQMVREGHYVGPHSDAHPLYCSWEDRSRTLITKGLFQADLSKNIADLQEHGALKPGQRVYFIPPFEWYNREIVEWSRESGVFLFNFTPGTGSNRDWAPPGHPAYVSAEKIVEDILRYERTQPSGLNGFLLLLHLGADRPDKVYRHLDVLISRLTSRGYRFKRVDELLRLP